jgi:PAS domain S-box-containing protein
VLILMRSFPGTDGQQMQALGFEGLRLITPADPRDSAALPLLAADGSLLATATWRPPLPGGLLVVWLLPATALVFVAMAVLLYLLLSRARKVAAAIAADGRRLAAQHSALEQSEARFRILFDEMLDGFALHEIITDETGKAVDYRFLAVNTAWEKMTSLSRGDVIGRCAREVLPETDPSWIERFGLAAHAGGAQSFESYSNALGRFLQVRAYCTEPGRFAVIFQDVTMQKMADAAVHESLERFRQIFQKHDAAMLLIDPQECTILDANPAAEHFYGFDPDKMVGLPITLLNTLSPEDVALQLQRAAREERSRLNFPRRLPGGELRTVELSTLRIVMHGRSVLFSIIHDIPTS